MKRLLAKVWKLLNFPPKVQVKILRLFQDSYLVGVTGIIFNKQNQILLVKHTYRGSGWSLPGGYINAHEHPRQALEREIFEETGFTVSADTRIRIKTHLETTRIDITYIGTFIGGEFKQCAEVSEAAFFAFDELPKLTSDHIVIINHAIAYKNKQHHKK